MSHMNPKNCRELSRFLSLAVAVMALLFVASAHAAAPGIKGTAFNLNAGPGYSSQPDGELIYSWGYGCTGASPAPASFSPSTVAGATCPTMQLPGPTLIVTEGVAFTVTLTNNLPAPAGNTSIVFPGMKVTTTCPAAQQGLLTCEAVHGG